MTNKLNFVWIDDDPDRKNKADNLEDALGVSVKFTSIKGSSVDETIENLLNDTEPDLILLDHSLDQAISKTIKTGSTAATIIHEKWPTCPIISITGIDSHDISIINRSAYEAMFPVNRISEHYVTIKSIAIGFNILKGIQSRDLSSILDFINVPEEDRESVSNILPAELKGQNLTDQALFLEIFRWVKNILLSRPGFLYNELWTSTYLGLNEEGFNSVKEMFDDALYKGVFSDPSNPRWWKSRLLEILGENIDQFGLPWQIGRQLKPDRSELYSKCYVSEEPYPEVVAAVDETPNTEYHPMKLKYTETHSMNEDLLFFEDLRIMKPA